MAQRLQSKLTRYPCSDRLPEALAAHVPADAGAEAFGADAEGAGELDDRAEAGLAATALSNLATYEYFNGEFAAGDRAAKAAAAEVTEPGDLEPRDVIGQLNEYKERGEKFVARVKRGAEELEETGEEELENPIKGYGAPAGINGYEPGTGPT